MDIGGTFTDFVVVDEGPRSARPPARCSTTPANPAQGVLEGLRQFVPELAPGSTFLVHGTTVGLNAFLERKGTRLLLVMTEGLRDAYSIARHDRKELYALRYRKPRAARAAPRRRRGRASGCAGTAAVETPLDPTSLEPLFARIRGATASRRSRSASSTPTSTRTTSSGCATLLRAEFPELSVTLSHEIAREWREYERASIRGAERLHRAAGRALPRHARARARRAATSTSPLYVMQSNGGITTRAKRARASRSRRCSRARSAARSAARRSPGRPAGANLLCIDMGGTSFDLSLVVDGRPTVSTETELEGLPILMPLVDIHTIGAGGGSLAWLEAGGLRVGPQSAGADPGPACYGRGGTAADGDRREPLPRPARSGLLPRRPDDARRGARPSARSLGRRRRSASTTTELAEGMLAIINAQHGRRDADDHRQAGDRPARVLRSSPSAAPARCTPSGSRRSSRSAR